MLGGFGVLATLSRSSWAGYTLRTTVSGLTLHAAWDPSPYLGVDCKDHDHRTDQYVQHGDPEGEPLQPPPPESQHVGLFGIPGLFSSLGQLHQASPEGGPVRSHEPKEHGQQRVLGVKSETESREQNPEGVRGSRSLPSRTGGRSPTSPLPARPRPTRSTSAPARPP